MQLHANQIRERIYAGLLGKAIGVRLGAPVEPTIWEYERIRETFGEIDHYVRDFKNFAADDDTNGPFYFIRALRDYGLNPSAEQMGRTWVNYAAEEHGMFWWGGFGRSTEHTAYLNLRAGIPAPRSGSIAQNGTTVAEQIGGQIFIDSWGWVYPGRPAEAAEASAKAASVAHDGEGLNGARFVAAAIAAAFTETSIEAVIEQGLSTLDSSSTYTAVARAVLDFHAEQPDDWRACRDLLTGQWGYDRYPGVCHMIPNAGVLVMALIYGQGDLCRTVEIATMAGWDTDCNAGNAGAIVGTLQLPQEHWQKYRAPINDTLISSGVTGSFNIIDIPTFSRELAVFALQLAGSDVPANWKSLHELKGIDLGFELEGATHGFRSHGFNQAQIFGARSGAGEDGSPALGWLIDRFERGNMAELCWKPFYRREDFDDERYRPMFSPIVAAGQDVHFRLRLENSQGDGNIRLIPYVRWTLNSEIEEIGPGLVPDPDRWFDLDFTIPSRPGDTPEEVGIRAMFFGRLKYSGTLFVSHFSVTGSGRRLLKAETAEPEWGSISQFTFNRGNWTKEDTAIQGHTASDADLWTGNAYATDQKITTKLVCLSGTSHLVTFRAQGTERGYAAGRVGDEFVIVKRDFGEQILASAPADSSGTLDIEVEAKGSDLALRINGVALSARDGTFRYGMAGIRLGSAGRVQFSEIEIEELV